MEALPYLTILLSGLLLVAVGRYVYHKARLPRNKKLGWIMLFAGSVIIATILFFFAIVTIFGG